MDFFPVLELIDRLAIARVKWRRTRANSNELSYYETSYSRFQEPSIDSIIAQLMIIHDKIWDMEWQLKQGVEESLPLDEIGRRAIAIRNLNNQRIKLKNSAASIAGCQVQEIKHDHLSQ